MIDERRKSEIEATGQIHGIQSLVEGYYGLWGAASLDPNTYYDSLNRPSRCFSLHSHGRELRFGLQRNTGERQRKWTLTIDEFKDGRRTGDDFFNAHTIAEVRNKLVALLDRYGKAGPLR